MLTSSPSPIVRKIRDDGTPRQQRAAGEDERKRRETPLPSLSSYSSSPLPPRRVSALHPPPSRHSWKRLLLYRPKLHVQKIILSPPRFHLLGFFWAVTELLIFLITLFQTDLESLETVTLMLKSRVTQQVFLSQEEQDLSNVSEDSYVAMMVMGSLGLQSDRCGPAVGSPYNTFIMSHAVRTVSWTNGFKGDLGATIAGKREAAAVERGERRQREDGDGDEVRDASLDLQESQALTNRRMLDLILCNRSEALVDQRYILAAMSQKCKGPGPLVKISEALDLCKKSEDYHFQMLVSGMRNVCFFAFPRDNPHAGDSTCIRFGTDDVEREDLRWIMGRLRLIWDRFRASAVSWIVLSIVMRLLYWSRVVEVTKRGLLHLQTDCKPRKSLLMDGASFSSSPAAAVAGGGVAAWAVKKEEKEKEETAFFRAPEPQLGAAGGGRRRDEGGGERSLSLTTRPSSDITEEKRKHSATTGGGGGTARRGEDQAGKRDSKMKEEKRQEEEEEREEDLAEQKLREKRSFATAVSIGIACANNDSLYLSLAILRQILSGAYGELLIASAVTTPLSAWQAFGIVIYHEAIIQLVFRLVRRLLKGRSAVSGMNDVGVLGYLSMLLLSVTIQSCQLFNVDVLWLLTASNSVIATFWWLSLPTCGPDGPCMWSRGDILLHTVAALYTSALALMIQGAATLWRRYKRARKRRQELSLSSSSSPQAGAAGIGTGTGQEVSDEELVRGGDWWVYLGSVACPLCRKQVIEQPTVILPPPTSSATKVRSSKVRVSSVPIVQKAEKDSSSAGEREKELNFSDGCCLLRPCGHLGAHTAKAPEERKRDGQQMAAGPGSSMAGEKRMMAGPGHCCLLHECRHLRPDASLLLSGQQKMKLSRYRFMAVDAD